MRSSPSARCMHVGNKGSALNSFASGARINGGTLVSRFSDVGPLTARYEFAGASTDLRRELGLRTTNDERLLAVEAQQEPSPTSDTPSASDLFPGLRGPRSCLRGCSWRVRNPG